MTAILDRIVSTKTEEIKSAGQQIPEAILRRQAAERGPSRPFARQLRRSGPGRIGIIAEIKRASPSQGLLRADLDPGDYARKYEKGGAAAISVLTDRTYFQGSLEDLQQARAQTQLPVLRKDFLLCPYQLYESAARGADAVLLIARLLSESRLRDLLQLAGELQLDPLVEIHDQSDLDRATGAGAELIGINNRDLASFTTDLNVAARLAAELPPNHIPVAASGMAGRDDIRRTEKAGIYNCLVGESLVRAPDPVAFLRHLQGLAPNPCPASPDNPVATESSL